MITKHTSKEAVLNLAKDCKKCGNCCRHGSGFVLEEEIKQIADFLNISEERFKEKYLEEQILFNKKIHKFKTKSNKPYGECVFLNKNLCKIHDVKPLNCRIASCNQYGEELNEWFIVNHLLNPEDPVAIREWASRLKSKPTISGAELNELIPDTDKLNRILNYKIVR